jgi:hypothetical protein
MTTCPAIHIHIHNDAHGDGRALCAFNLQLAHILERLNTMPTNADLTAEIGSLVTTLTDAFNAEMEQLAVQLEGNAVSVENIQLIRAFKDAFAARLAAIVPDADPNEPPAE